MSDDLRNRVARAIQAVEIPESGWPEDRAGVWLMALDEAVKAADAAAMRQWKGCGKMDDLTKRLRDWQTVYPCDEDKPEGHLYVEAADRIEALERQVKAADALFDKVSGKYVDYTLVEALAAYRATKEGGV